MSCFIALMNECFIPGRVKGASLVTCTPGRTYMDGKTKVYAVSGKQIVWNLRVHQAVHTWIANPRFIAVSGMQIVWNFRVHRAVHTWKAKPRFRQATKSSGKAALADWLATELAGWLAGWLAG
jgi:hypothetical protein